MASTIDFALPQKTKSDACRKNASKFATWGAGSISREIEEEVSDDEMPVPCYQSEKVPTSYMLDDDAEVTAGNDGQPPRYFSERYSEKFSENMKNGVKLTQTLVGDEEWSAVLIQAFFRPTEFGEDSDDEASEMAPEEHEAYVESCKQVLRSLLPRNSKGS
mmetsp:Transcript_137702/g.250316  ORF Transcript_137702/g.250316 Transcript_137702/m.250316 type:complete len:161 (-) Transcript_137702:62-544(-)